MSIAQSNGIKSDNEFLDLASTQVKNGFNELTTFIANTPKAVYRELDLKDVHEFLQIKSKKGTERLTDLHREVV